MNGGGRPRPTGPGPGRWLLAAVLATPVVEIAVAVAVARVVGAGWTLAAIGALTVLGVVVLRRAGRAAVQSLGTVVDGSVVDGTVVDGRGPQGAARASSARGADLALEAAGGVLLVFPGLVTGAVGLLLVVPPTRRLLRPALGLTASRLVGSAARRADLRVVPGDAVDVQVVEVRDLDDPGRP